MRNIPGRLPVAFLVTALAIELLDELVDDGLRFCVSVFSIDHTGVMPDGTGLRDEVTFRDMEVVPDLATLRVVPWERETAICLGDCYFDGSPLPAAPRGILQRAIAEAEARGLRVKCGHELEFFLLRRTPEGRFESYATAPGLVYRLDPRVDPQGVLRAMEDGVRGLGVNVVSANQEYDPSQWEINCKYDEALRAADDGRGPRGPALTLAAGIGHEREWIEYWSRLAAGEPDATEA